MNIACFGDSWTYGYGLKNGEKWPKVLSKELKTIVKNFGQCGVSNEYIFQKYKEFPGKADILIFCWTSITRLETPHGMMDFSYVTDNLLNSRSEFYAQYSLQDLFTKWEDMMLQVNEENPNKTILHYSVFGDAPTRKIKNFYKPSMLEYLANKQGHNFQYDIPIFEYDWLSDNNLSLTEPFAKKYFDKNWKKAIVEREDIRLGKYFLNCGHPNAKGANLWAKFVKDNINDLFSK